MRIAQIFAALLLAALATIMLAAPAAAGTSASCSEPSYSTWDFWRFEPSTGGCSHLPGDAYTGREETLLFIGGSSSMHEFEIHAMGENGSDVPVAATCEGADCASVQDMRPYASVGCRGTCSMTYSYSLNNEPVVIEMDVDIRQQSFDAVATYGDGGTTMIGVTSQANELSAEHGVWEVLFTLEEPTTNPFIVPQVDIWGGRIENSYWQTDSVLYIEIQADPGTVFATLHEGTVATRQNTRNSGDTASFKVSEPSPMVELGPLSQAQGQNMVTARYNARSDVDHHGDAPQISGPAGMAQDMVDPFGGDISIPLTGPGRITLTLPTGFYRNAFNDQSEAQGPVSIDAVYGIELQSLSAPHGARAGDPVRLTARATSPENQGQVRFLAGGEILGTAPLVDGHATFEATMPNADTAFSAEILEVFGFVQHGAAVSSEVIREKKTLELSIDAPATLRLGEEAHFRLTVSDPEFSGALVFSTQDGQFSRSLPADTRQISFTPERAGPVVFQLTASNDADFEAAEAVPTPREVAKRDATLSLQATPTQAHPGDRISLSLTLSEPGIETGQLVALVNGEVIQTASMSGATEVEISHQVMQAGKMDYEIRLSGSASHEDARSNIVSAHVSQIEGTLSLTADAGTAEVGDEVAITASIPDGHDGTLRILRNGQIVAEHNAEQAGPHYSFEATEPGVIAFTAELVGGTRHADLRSGTFEVAVSSMATNLLLEATPGQAAPGDKIAVAATLAPADATGVVTFIANGKTVAVQPIDGQGRAMFEFIAGETDVTFEASFSPDTSRHMEAVAQPAQLTVSKVQTALTLSADRHEAVPGDDITLTATFTEAPSDGIVVFYAGDDEIYSTKVDGRASYIFKTIAAEAGQTTYTASLGESTRFAQARSNQVAVIAERIVGALELTLDASNSHPGAEIGVSVVLTPNPQGGEVSLLLDGNVVAVEPAAGEMRFTFEAPEAGSHEIKAHFTGDHRIEPTTTSKAFSTAKAEVAVVLSSDHETAVSGDIVTLVAASQPATATGSMVFFNQDEEIGRGLISEGSVAIEWVASSGVAHLRAQYEGDDAHQAATSNTLAFSVDASTDEVFVQKAPQLQKAVQAETRRAAQARMRHHEWMMRDARTRLRSQGSAVSRSYMPFSYNGMLKANDDGAFAKGSFYGGGEMGGYRRYIYGAFDLAREEGYGTTLEFNGAVAWEKTLGSNFLGGAYVGAEIGRTNLSNGFDGEIDTMGVNAGIYGAKRIADNVVIDGFANIARLSHDITLADEEISAKGRYDSTALQLGGAITGEHQLRSLTLAPQLAAVHSISWTEDADMTADGASGTSDVILDGGTSKSTRLSATPEMILPVGENGLAELSFAPRAICQVEKADNTTRGCGIGLGLGFDRDFARKAGHFSADFEVEEVSGRRREMLRFDVTLDF